MFILKEVNLALSFLLELCLLAAYGFWGFKLGGGLLPVQILLGVGMPILLGVIWGIFLAPTSSQRLAGIALLSLKIILFGIAVLALYIFGKAGLAFSFAVLFVINMILAYVWGQERLSPGAVAGQN
ncbi:MAG: YrdB family protein [Anaerolineaceae bacterium]|nr:YrdB family protein [Anaerolineaceae bacterium]